MVSSILGALHEVLGGGVSPFTISILIIIIIIIINSKHYAELPWYRSMLLCTNVTHEGTVTRE